MAATPGSEGQAAPSFRNLRALEPEMTRAAAALEHAPLHHSQEALCAWCSFPALFLAGVFGHAGSARLRYTADPMQRTVQAALGIHAGVNLRFAAYKALRQMQQRAAPF